MSAGGELRTVVSRLLPASGKRMGSQRDPEGLNSDGREEALEVENHLRARAKAAMAGWCSSETQEHRLKEANLMVGYGK